ncbi:hypothetical protein [Pseudomonas sp. p99-361]|uniref:hypothetical protein n=1 Tax=Pseudomonas sp. p99-361 TaxID=2479852 RepID=UPI000F7A4192|nr:hypothetical protein [Pseudomonas sp. p99-361]
MLKLIFCFVGVNPAGRRMLLSKIDDQPNIHGWLREHKEEMGFSAHLFYVGLALVYLLLITLLFQACQSR